MTFWYTNFQKSPWRGRGTPSPPPPRSDASLLDLAPLLNIPGYTTVAAVTYFRQYEELLVEILINIKHFDIICGKQDCF